MKNSDTVQANQMEIWEYMKIGGMEHKNDKS